MKNRYLLILLLFLFFNSATSAQKNRKPETTIKKLVTPTIDDLLKISRVGWSTAISPDGRYIAYDISKPNFNRDVNLNEIWITEVTTGKSYQPTKAEDDFYDIKWSPDGKWITYLSGRSNQVVCIPVNGGEPAQLTKAPNGVGYFAWSPDGKHLAFTSNENEPEHLATRKTHSGNFTVVGERPALNCLWTVEVDHSLKEPASATQLTSDIYINGFLAPFSWSPDGSKIAFGGISQEKKTDLSPDIYSLTLADGSIKQVVSLYGRDRDPQWSPDGK